MSEIVMAIMMIMLIAAAIFMCGLIVYQFLTVVKH